METKERIIEAAVEVFADKGRHGARMEAIASIAEVNKAMVYYYFNSKDNLYNEVLLTIAKNIYEKVRGDLDQVLSEEDNPRVRLERFIGIHFKAFTNNRHYTEIIMRALANEPEETKELLENFFMNIKGSVQNVSSIYEEGVSQNLLRDIDFPQFMLNIIGMNMIYFMARPIADVLFNMDSSEEKEFLENRSGSIIDLVFHGILK